MNLKLKAMKKNIYTLIITISFLVVNIPFQLFGQGRGIWCEPDTIIAHTILYQTEDSILLAPERRAIATYNDALQKTSETISWWDETEQAFDNPGEILYTFTYNVLGLLETKTEFFNYDYDSTDNFFPSSRYSYLYDTLGNITEDLYETADSLGEFSNSYLYIYTYNEQGDMTSSMFHTWHIGDQTWTQMEGSQHFYLYDENFNILHDTVMYTFYYSNPPTTSLYLYRYIYYPNGNLQSQVTTRRVGENPWERRDSIVFLYDDNNNMTRWTNYVWNEDSMDYIYASWNGRMTYTYDENNNRTSAVRESYNHQEQTWEVDSWNPKLVWTYDENDNATLIESFAWNTNINGWEHSYSGHVDLYYNNMRSGYEMFDLGGAIFNIHYICKEESVAVKETKNPTVLIYPNPAQDRVFISGITEKSQLAIYDISGKLVLKQTISSEQAINVNHLKSGIYLINIRNKNHNITKKLVISE